MPNVFPDITPTRWDIEPEALQERDSSQAGDIQINAYDPVLQFFPRGEWELLSESEGDQIEDHWWINRTGVFTLFDFKLRKARGLWVAIADGASTIYTLPAKSVATPTIKHDGVAAASQPALLVGTGTDGEDRIQYSVAPTTGIVITLDAAAARERWEVYYGNTRFPRRDVEGDIDSLALDFIHKVIA